jgi:hypothetical protein
MKIKALITTLVLGSSSLALAAPAYNGPAVRDHRTLPAPRPAPLPAPTAQARFNFGFAWHRPVARPLLLANNTRVAGMEDISVAQGRRAFTKLELKANSGRTNLELVVIRFANGQSQTVNLRGNQNGVIKAGKSVTIDLAGNARYIQSIKLIGKSGRRASIDVLAL